MHRARLWYRQPRLPQPVFTPSTKADQGHDESITFEDASRKVGAAVMTYIRDRSLELYRLAASYALRRGIIIADTKFEWGLTEDSRDPILIDEALTPDSSRFWPAGDYVAGREQVSFDKQYVRNYTSHGQKLKALLQGDGGIIR